MFKTLSFSLLLASTAAASFLPETYEASTAADKKQSLMDLLESTKGTKGSFPGPLGLAAFIARDDLSPTVNTYSDEVPYSNKHGKRIHSVGAVCSATFEAAPDTQFTGMFTGNDNVIARLSVAASPKEDNITPGIAVKFLRDGVPSANFVAMYSLDGQESPNFFENKFSNHVDPPVSGILKLLAAKFQLTSDPAEMVGLSDISATEVDGTPVAEADRLFPYEIIMTPNPELNLKLDELSNIKAGTLLYTMEARVEPTETVLVPLGTLTATSDLFFSKAGDEILFFRHQRMSEDVELRPEWKEAVGAGKSFLDHLLGKSPSKCPLGYGK